jgi:hypothetical protein
MKCGCADCTRATKSATCDKRRELDMSRQPCEKLAVADWTKRATRLSRRSFHHPGDCETTRSTAFDLLVARVRPCPAVIEQLISKHVNQTMSGLWRVGTDEQHHEALCRQTFEKGRQCRMYLHALAQRLREMTRNDGIRSMLEPHESGQTSRDRCSALEASSWTLTARTAHVTHSRKRVAQRRTCY